MYLQVDESLLTVDKNASIERVDRIKYRNALKVSDEEQIIEENKIKSSKHV